MSEWNRLERLEEIRTMRSRIWAIAFAVAGGALGWIAVGKGGESIEGLFAVVSLLCAWLNWARR